MVTCYHHGGYHLDGNELGVVIMCSGALQLVWQVRGHCSLGTWAFPATYMHVLNCFQSVHPRTINYAHVRSGEGLGSEARDTVFQLSLLWYVFTNNIWKS